VTLTLTVPPPIQRNAADGYNLEAVAPDAPAIAVSGPLNLLQALPSVSTETLDVSGLRADSTRTARLRLPAELQTARDNVSVRLHVVPATGEVSIAVPPQVVGVDPGLEVGSVPLASVP